MEVAAPYHTGIAHKLMLEWGESLAFASTPDLVAFKEALLELMAEEGERDETLTIQEEIARYLYRRYAQVHPNSIRSQLFKFARAESEEERRRIVRSGRNAPPTGPYWWELPPHDTGK